MPTLHKATEETKSIIKWGVISIFALILLVILIRTGINIKEYFFPTPLPPPTVSFGKLPAIIFPEATKNTSYSYSINTITGALPHFADRVNIYKLNVPQPSLLDLKNAEDRVGKVGFTNTPTPLTTTLYFWNDPQQPTRRLVLDIVSYNFTLADSYLTDPNVLSAKNLSDEKYALEKVKQFLTNMSLLPADVNLDKAKTSVFGIKNAKVTPATSLSQAQLIRVDLFQNDVNNLPIVYSERFFSTMHFFIGSGPNQPNIVDAGFIHYDVTNESATYPIISTDEAYKLLKTGKAYVPSSVSKQAKNDIVIRNVSLAYYLGEQKQDYLMPVFIFDGDDGFYAYVPAVKENWTLKAQSQ